MLYKYANKSKHFATHNIESQSRITIISVDKNNGGNNQYDSYGRLFRTRRELHQYVRSCMVISTHILLRIESKSPKKEDGVNLDKMLNEDSLFKWGKLNNTGTKYCIRRDCLLEKEQFLITI